MKKISMRFCNSKSIIFSFILFVAIIFILYTNSLVHESHEIKSKKQAQTQNSDSLIAPKNVTVEERIKWFKKKLPDFQIFKSNGFTQRFHIRVTEIMEDNNCEVHFFMTWIAPIESFGRRQFLGMDTLFKVHPNGCLIIISETLDSLQGRRILKPLVVLGFKVRAVTPDLPSLFNNTPAETWLNEITSGVKDPGEVPLSQNLSNLIRLVAIYKYGGVYLDTDFIILKSFSGLRNSIGGQTIDDVSKIWTFNNAVLIFDRSHPLVYRFIHEFAATFDGNKWGHNGPKLVSRVAQKLAQKPEFNFTVMPATSFYPIEWSLMERFYKKPENSSDLRWVQKMVIELISGDVYAVHLWNKFSQIVPIEDGSAMAILISHSCVICDYIYTP
ncbi:uncharacterized protein LOC126672630 [Mercurialis annua]|uniref:uncharacterized protein LOC126672630 n=1 Tax=Mercurialis annua TaxID=3986 RepID=UPI0021603087|nr:uncharacterized protein LOC126672630 [Mercurialis annua]